MSKESIEISEFDKRYLDGFVEKCAAAKADPIEMAKQAGIDKIAKGNMLKYISRLLGSNVRRAGKGLSKGVQAPGATDEGIAALAKKLTQAKVKSKGARRKALPFLAGITGGLGAGAAGGAAVGNAVGQSGINLEELLSQQQ